MSTHTTWDGRPSTTSMDRRIMGSRFEHCNGSRTLRNLFRAFNMASIELRVATPNTKASSARLCHREGKSRLRTFREDEEYAHEGECAGVHRILVHRSVQTRRGSRMQQKGTYGDQARQSNHAVGRGTLLISIHASRVVLDRLALEERPPGS